MMIPVVSALIFALLSFFCSAFVILRITIPILPPHPLSKRVSPTEFGLPPLRTMSLADKAHIWLASLDLISLAIFIWQCMNEVTGGISGLAVAVDPASSVRMWIILITRQTILLVVAGITLLHVLFGITVSFGGCHWLLWAPTLLLLLTSTTMAAVISVTRLRTLFYGLIAYNSIITLMTLVIFLCLLRMLSIIKRNLDNDICHWSPTQAITQKPRLSFATEDIDALREGGSWISSTSSSCRNSFSTWSFSTHHSQNHDRVQNTGQPSVCVNSSNTSHEDIPLVPALYTLPDPNPPHRGSPNRKHALLGSQSSWLTSVDGTRSTMSAWSFSETERESSVRSPTIRHCPTPATLVASRHNTPALGSTQPLGGYGYVPRELERGISHSLSACGANIEISLIYNIGWLLFILIPYAFSLPYLVAVSHNIPSPLVGLIFLELSVTLSSPVLAINLLLKRPFPIPTGIFDISTQFPLDLHIPMESAAPSLFQVHACKRSMAESATVVEGRRGGDVWIAKGDAVDGKSKLGRAIETLNPCPKLSVIPPKECPKEPVSTSSLSFSDDVSLPATVHNAPEGPQFYPGKTDSRTSSHLFGADENLAVPSKIMVAQRHYSALAQTVIIPSMFPSKMEKPRATGIASKRTSGHLRSRPVSLVNGPSTPTPAETSRINTSPTPPPPFPLPPTPPSVRMARLALAHKNFSSSGIQINVRTAGVLPLLVYGLRAGNEYRVKDRSPSESKTSKNRNEFNLDISSSRLGSTPVLCRKSKQSGHRRNRYSLLSLGHGKDGSPSLTVLRADSRGPLDKKAVQYELSNNIEFGWMNTDLCTEAFPVVTRNRPGIREPGERNEGKATGSNHRRLISCPRGLSLVFPQETRSVRSSLSAMIPPLSTTSSVTLFEDIEANFASGPIAESTPHNTVTQRKSSRQPPSSLPFNRRKGSSIAYIIPEASSKGEASTSLPNTESTTGSAITSFAQRSIRGVKPLLPNSRYLQRKIFNASFTDSRANTLRPLILLKSRNINSPVKPLGIFSPRLEKQQEPCRAVKEYCNENTDPNASDSSRGGKDLKPLKLARSGTVMKGRWSSS